MIFFAFLKKMTLKQSHLLHLGFRVFVYIGWTDFGPIFKEQYLDSNQRLRLEEGTMKVQFMLLRMTYGFMVIGAMALPPWLREKITPLKKLK